MCYETKFESIKYELSKSKSKFGFHHIKSSNPFAAALCYGQEQERTPSVIVIGGGMAGIAAARALHDASFQVFYLYCFMIYSSWNSYVALL